VHATAPSIGVAGSRSFCTNKMLDGPWSVIRVVGSASWYGQKAQGALPACTACHSCAR